MEERHDGGGNNNNNNINKKKRGLRWKVTSKRERVREVGTGAQGRRRERVREELSSGDTFSICFFVLISWVKHSKANA